MIISRKKYEEAIERAKHETEERMWQEQRIARIEEQLHRRMDELADRLASVEARQTACSKYSDMVREVLR